MDQMSAILTIVKTGADLISHLIQQVGREDPALVVERFRAYAQSVYDADRKGAEDILEERRRKGEIT